MKRTLAIVSLVIAVAAIWSITLAGITVQVSDDQGNVLLKSVIETPASPTSQPATQPVVIAPGAQPGDVVSVDLPASPATQPATPAVPAAVRGASGALKLVKLNGKPLRGSFEISDTLIDANGQSRVIEPAPGVRQVLRNCKIVNVGRSVVEKSVQFAAGDKPYALILDRVTTEGTPGYSVFVDGSWKSGKSMADGAMVHVTLSRCDLGSSLYETVVRLMPGVDATIDDSRIWDTVDLDKDGKPSNPPNKAHSALRGHCNNLVATKSTVAGYAKFGFVNAPTQSIKLISIDFSGGVEWEGKVASRVVDACTLNGKVYR